MRITVIGAGIGGLVLAAGLQRDGHDVQVFERRPDCAPVGAGLTLFGNAFQALDALGLGTMVREISSDAAGRLTSGQRQPSGRWLLAIAPDQAPSVRSLHRTELHRELLGHLEPNTVRPGCEALVDPGGKPEVTVDGQRHTADLVVAADGLRSPSRQRWGLD